MTDSITEAATRRLPPPGRLVRLWPRVRPYRWQLVLASLALVASGLLALAYFNGKAKAEERWLVRRYPAYESYMRQVPRRVL